MSTRVKGATVLVRAHQLDEEGFAERRVAGRPGAERGATAFVRVDQAVASTPGVVGGTRPRFLRGVHGRPGVAIANVYPKGSPQDVSTADLLHTVRNQVVPAAELMPAAKAWVGKLAQYSPTAIRFLKASFNADTDHQGGLSQLSQAGLDVFSVTGEAKEGAAAFAEKRKPDFTAHQLAH